MSHLVERLSPAQSRLRVSRERCELCVAFRPTHFVHVQAQYVVWLAQSWRQ